MFLNRNVVATVALSLLLAIGQVLTPLAVGAELAAPSGEANYNDALDWASGSSGDSFAAGILRSLEARRTPLFPNFLTTHLA